MTSLNAEAIARKLVDKLCDLLPGNTAYGRLHDATPMIQEVLTTFAAQQVQATLEGLFHNLFEGQTDEE